MGYGGTLSERQLWAGYKTDSAYRTSRQTKFYLKLVLYLELYAERISEYLISKESAYDFVFVFKLSKLKLFPWL